MLKNEVLRFLMLAALVWSGPVLAETRVALIIGNGAYTGNFPALNNPRNDALALSDALEKLDFGVHIGLDADRSSMVNLIERFQSEADTADVALFFFAGHGIQIDSKNYIFPVDAELTGVSDALDDAVAVDHVISSMTPTGTDGQEGDTSKIRLVFLDACRDNPLGEAGQAAIQKGLARVGSAAGFLFAYATQPDNVAYDGMGSNSPFTGALLNHISTPGQDISELMIAVRNDVLKQTGGLQVPWENSSLTRQFRFDPRTEEASLETQFFQVAAASGDNDLMGLYLDRYPDGAHAGEAQDILVATNHNSTLDSRNERVLWSLAERVRSLKVVETYLEKFPNGSYAEEATRLRRQLENADEASPERTCERMATHPRDSTVQTRGVSLSVLSRYVDLATEACEAAALANPEQPHFTALLARAKMAGGETTEAVQLYRDAAERGDLRAMVSLGIMHENGGAVPQDFLLAETYYERAAVGGSADGAINLAVMNLSGRGLERDVPRAISLLVEASDGGSPIATYNLGALLEEGYTDPAMTKSSLEYFTHAARYGEKRGYLAAAIILDEGRYGDADPAEAARMLLRGVAEDSGEALSQLTQNSKNWNRETIREIQTRLKTAGLYQATVDGLSGPSFEKALRSWRLGGYRTEVLD